MIVSKRVILMGGALLLSLLVQSLGPRSAFAGLSGCRSDPAVLLSNGAVLDLSADIADSQDDVQNADYVLHVPSGLHAVAVVNTDGVIGLKETFHLYADSPPNSYRTITTITTGAAGVSVTAESEVVSVLGVTLGAHTASGVSGQALQIQFD